MQVWMSWLIKEQNTLQIINEIYTQLLISDQLDQENAQWLEYKISGKMS